MELVNKAIAECGVRTSPPAYRLQPFASSLPPSQSFHADLLGRGERVVFRLLDDLPFHFRETQAGLRKTQTGQSGRRLPGLATGQHKDKREEKRKAYGES